MHTDPRGPPEVSSAVLMAPCPDKATVPVKPLSSAFHFPPVLRGPPNVQVKGLTAGSASTYIFGAGYLSYVLFLSLNIPRGNDSIEHVALNEFIYPQHLEPGISEHTINATYYYY